MFNCESVFAVKSSAIQSCGHPSPPYAQGPPPVVLPSLLLLFLGCSLPIIPVRNQRLGLFCQLRSPQWGIGHARDKSHGSILFFFRSQKHLWSEPDCPCWHPDKHAVEDRSVLRLSVRGRPAPPTGIAETQPHSGAALAGGPSAPRPPMVPAAQFLKPLPLLGPHMHLFSRDDNSCAPAWWHQQRSRARPRSPAQRLTAPAVLVKRHPVVPASEPTVE